MRPRAGESSPSQTKGLIGACADVDPVIEDMVIAILSDEQGHMRELEGFLREYESGRD